MHEFRSHFVGKVSPVHFFWGAMDLACTRFSGRTAPKHPGGAPNCGDWVMVEGYSHELSSCGFWPGGGDEGAFYAYAYPEPDGFADYPVAPRAAFYSTDNGQFLLPYEAVRTAADPTAPCWSSYRPPIRPPPNAAIGTAPHSKPIRAGGMRNGERQLDRGNPDIRFWSRPVGGARVGLPEPVDRRVDLTGPRPGVLRRSSDALRCR